MAIDLSSYVRVVNTHDHEVVGRYNGEDYVFKPGEPEDIHISAAGHIFGFGMDDKTKALHALGVLRQSDELKAAMEYLGKIKFEPVPDIPRIGAKQASDAGPHVHAGGNPPETGVLASGEELPAEAPPPPESGTGAPRHPSQIGTVSLPSKRR
jgi:hypothetical protein